MNNCFEAFWTQSTKIVYKLTDSSKTFCTNIICMKEINTILMGILVGLVECDFLDGENFVSWNFLSGKQCK
jgi:hypothetical protein